MSAPSIPNLLSLRGSRGGGRGRGFGRSRDGRGGSSSPASTTTPGHDATIQGTDTDAAVSRLSAVELGYLDDEYARVFAPRTAPGPASRRLPIINRGTYTRTTAIDAIVARFLETTKNNARQIISLGAGTATRPIRTVHQYNMPCEVYYHEVDFPTTCKEKLRIIRNSPGLKDIVLVTSASLEADSPSTTPPTIDTPPIRWEATFYDERSNQWWFHGVDLRSLAAQQLQKTIPKPTTPSSPSSGGAPLAPPTPPPFTTPATPTPTSPNTSPLIKGIRTDLPTLLISECCLCYLSPAEASGIIDYFSSLVPNLGIVLYEPIRPGDAFGRMMVNNLAARSIRMPTLSVYKEPSDQEQRLRDAGFTTVNQMTIDQVWEKWIPTEEKERVDGLEGLDEVEEWLLLAGHYILAWGSKGGGFELPGSEHTVPIDKKWPES